MRKLVISLATAATTATVLLVSSGAAQAGIHLF